MLGGEVQYIGFGGGGGGGFSLAVNCKLIEEPHPVQSMPNNYISHIKIDNTFGNTFKSSNEIKDTYIKLVHW